MSKDVIPKKYNKLVISWVTHALYKAHELNATSLGLPAVLGDDVFGPRLQTCIRLMLQTILQWLERNGHLTKLKTIKICEMKEHIID